MTETAEAPRVLDLVFYGIVNAGKSSLLNALAGRSVQATSPIGGTTEAVGVEPWRDVPSEIGPFLVRLVDTPGLEEVDDATREPMSTAAALRADLVVFVAAEDLTASALVAVKTLRDVGKPMLIAVNKMDLLDPHEQAEVLASIRERLSGTIPPEDILPASAAPLIRHREIDAEGVARVRAVRGEPDIEELRSRLLDVLAVSAADLNALNTASAQIDRHVIERDEELTRRRRRAERVADETSVALALALAVNPVPLLDFLTGSGGLVVLVKRVAGVYGGEITPEQTRIVAMELLRGGRLALWGSLAAVGVGGVLKFVPGLGHLAGALAQGTAGGYLGHIMGRALVDYFENGHDWGDGGIVALLDRIAASTDRKALTRGIVDQLKTRLASTRKSNRFIL